MTVYPHERIYAIHGDRIVAVWLVATLGRIS